MRRHVSQSKFDPLANPNYAHVRLQNECETTVSLKE